MHDDKKKSGFTAEDFLKEDAFICWIRDPEGESALEWRGWLEMHPEYAGEVQKATELYRRLREVEKKIPPREMENDIWCHIEDAISGKVGGGKACIQKKDHEGSP